MRVGAGRRLPAQGGVRHRIGRGRTSAVAGRRWLAQLGGRSCQWISVRRITVSHGSVFPAGAHCQQS